MNSPIEMDSEVPLPGGRYTVGVVRVGDTVRRPAGIHSDFVRLVLLHLEKSGFKGSPRYLGIDERGRDTFKYIPGWVPQKFQKFTDDQIRSAGALLKRFHEATLGWNNIGPDRVICHHDPGPNNVVFDDGKPIAFIDFDFAAPGNPIEDLGYMAWSWCISSKPDRLPVETQASQLRVLIDSYGLDSMGRVRIVDAILRRQNQNILFWNERKNGFHGMPASREEVESRISWSRRELEFTAAHRELFNETIKD